MTQLIFFVLVFTYAAVLRFLTARDIRAEMVADTWRAEAEFARRAGCMAVRAAPNPALEQARYEIEQRHARRSAFLEGIAGFAPLHVPVVGLLFVAALCGASALQTVPWFHQ